MPMPRNPYRDNAFMILGMPISASTQELSAAARKLEKRIQVRLQEGNLAQVIEARRRVEDPNQRIAEELFCYAASGHEDRELQRWIDRFAPCPVTLGEAADWRGWQAHLHRLSMDPQADFAEPEPIRVTILERGERYEGAMAPEETIVFAR